MALILVVMMLVISCHCQSYDKILRDDFDPPIGDGAYKWALQTEGGIYHEQVGSSVDGGSVVRGQYQYTAPDGQLINVVYVADKDGFRAEGSHLPTPPPLPPHVQRTLQLLDTNTVK